MALTTEDMAWLERQFQTLRTEMDERFQRVDDRFQAIDDRFQAMDDRFETLRAQLEHTLHTEIERVETRLLTEFHKWASPNEARQRTHHAAIRDLDLQLEALEERVRKLEERQPQ